uniref:Uncharacterized protein n=1 Tax=Tetraselmis sp. GSL018 TaxID=582737 RepID=A0A061R6B8_9CHLO
MANQGVKSSSKEKYSKSKLLKPQVKRAAAPLNLFQPMSDEADAKGSLKAFPRSKPPSVKPGYEMSSLSSPVGRYEDSLSKQAGAYIFPSRPVGAFEAPHGSTLPPGSTTFPESSNSFRAYHSGMPDYPVLVRGNSAGAEVRKGPGGQTPRRARASDTGVSRMCALQAPASKAVKSKSDIVSNRNLLVVVVIASKLSMPENF